MTVPNFISKLSVPMQANNFTPVQSAQRTVTASSASVTFTTIPGTGRVTYKITNTGTKGCYIATGNTTATAVASSSTPTPAFSSSVESVATCDYISPGQTIKQDYAPGTDTVAAICGGSDTTTLEITIGYGQ